MPLDCAHIYGRASLSTRWAPDNAMALCRTCHRMMTDNPDHWEYFCRARLGDDAYEELGRKARMGAAPDLDEVYRGLNEISNKSSS